MDISVFIVAIGKLSSVGEVFTSPVPVTSIGPEPPPLEETIPPPGENVLKVYSLAAALDDAYVNGCGSVAVKGGASCEVHTHRFAVNKRVAG